jgi:uncharacterized membrane protein YfcA
VVELLIALIAAVMGALVGAWIQRRLTPDYSVQLSAPQKQVAACAAGV